MKGATGQRAPIVRRTEFVTLDDNRETPWWQCAKYMNGTELVVASDGDNSLEVVCGSVCLALCYWWRRPKAE